LEWAVFWGVGGNFCFAPQTPQNAGIFTINSQRPERKKYSLNDNDVYKFTCKECGDHMLLVTHVWSVLAGDNSERWQEWGPLKDNHHWKYEGKEKIEENRDDEVQRGDFSEFEEDESTSEPEDYEIHKPETDRESDEYFVNCGYCDHEIEFGWSEPDRRGLILPVEFSDFIPSESWPDPKYLNFWQQKGWLRP
jgi:hypothetical protein